MSACWQSSMGEHADTGTHQRVSRIQTAQVPTDTLKHRTQVYLIPNCWQVSCCSYVCVCVIAWEGRPPLHCSMSPTMPDCMFEFHFQQSDAASHKHIRLGDATHIVREGGLHRYAQI